VLQYVEEKEKLEEKHLLPHTIVGEKKGESKVLNKVPSAGAVLRSRSPRSRNF
jgi:protein-arginine kinase